MFLNKKVFYPPIVFLVITLLFSLIYPDQFLVVCNQINQWILTNFDWLFSWSSFLFLLLVIAIYISPFGKKKIGGDGAKPILSKWQWFAITLCTTVATGILFWGSAEPLHHFNTPPTGLGLEPGSSAAQTFAMSTMFMHWTIIPYGIYTLAGLTFAYCYYNLKQPYSLSSLLYPLLGDRAHGSIGTIINIICLYALVAGMSASLGAGILALMGGLDTVAGIPQSSWLMALIAILIVSTFIVSAVSGLQKGITFLSVWNVRAFFLLAAIVFLWSPISTLFQIGAAGMGDFFQNFLSRSTNINSQIDADWQHSWTIFYWANWFAWTPITALFLGRLGYGYSVRQFVHFNLLFPSLFAVLWVVTFGGSTLAIDQESGGQLYEIMSASGEQNVLYELFNRLSMGQSLGIFSLIMIFISYVTAADSNTSAMSAMCSTGVSPENPEAPLWIKVTWGIIIGMLTFVMLNSAGIDGVRMISVLGGFPALFFIILVALGVGMLVVRGSKSELKADN